MRRAELDLADRAYWLPTQRKLERLVERVSRQRRSETQAVAETLDCLTSILLSSRPEVEAVIDAKVARREIRDRQQAIVSVAGSNYQTLVAYALAWNSEVGNIPRSLRISMKRSVDGRRILGEYAEIHLGDEVQKPDMDVVVYSPQQETPITLLSCKTSLRERAGQTIKWKLLLDLATSRCTHKTGNNDCPATRYALRIDTTRPIRVVFVTADLYGETAQPQQAGLLSLFDAAYVTKPSADIPQGIVPFSDIVSYIRSQYPDG